MSVLSSLCSHARTVSLLPILVLGACSASRAGYPSLAQRPAEREYAQNIAARTAPAPEVAGSPDPATLSQIATLRAAAAHASESFAHDADEARHLAQSAHGTTVGSDAWAAATIAMASLDSDHSAMVFALADLDSLRIKTAVSAADSNDATGHATYAAVASADSAVAAMLSDQEARIAALHKSFD